MSEPKLEAFRSMIAAGRSATEHELLSVVGWSPTNRLTYARRMAYTVFVGHHTP